MQLQSVPPVSTPVFEPGRRSALLIDGGNACGKSTRGQIVAEATGYSFFDVGEHLRQNKQHLPEEVLSSMRSCGYVPDQFIIPILKRQVYNAPNTSKVFVGVRTVPQAQELLLDLYNFRYTVVYLKLHRGYEDCLNLSGKRGREDSEVQDFNTRWALYEEHSPQVESFFRSRGVVRVIHYTLTDDPDHDKWEILKLVQPHCRNFVLPKAVTEQLAQ